MRILACPVQGRRDRSGSFCCGFPFRFVYVTEHLVFSLILLLLLLKLHPKPHRGLDSHSTMFALGRFVFFPLAWLATMSTGEVVWELVRVCTRRYGNNYLIHLRRFKDGLFGAVGLELELFGTQGFCALPSSLFRLGTFLDLCVAALRKGHTSLLCALV